ncbi:M14 family metallopeptidase [Priestia aryabhattai]|uniref:M14 family metallopeptidase n=1 Tax=Priestia aryabhattai TaxID=412384 RepID=UPI0015F38B66|nr:M14 family metallopeptidase [Priestia aryabhattai]
MVDRIDEIDVVKADVGILKESIDAALLSGQHADQVAEKVGVLSDLTTDAKDDLVGAINSTESKVKSLSQLPNEYEWTALAGQLDYTLPAGSSYNTSVKSFQVEVGGGGIPPSKVNKVSSTKFSLLLPASDIIAGVKVVARWTQPLVASGSGSGSGISNGEAHHLSHELGGMDEIDITKLKGYTANVSGKIGDTSKLETKSQTNLVDSVNEVLTKSNSNLVDIANISNKVGNLGSLQTSVQTSIVDAINSINSGYESSPVAVGSLDDLHTENKSSIVNAINENSDKIGVLQKNPNEFEWTATAGQLIYTLPTNTSYDINSKVLEVMVGGAFVSPSMIQKDSATQFTLLVDSSRIPAGIKVVARWTESVVAGTGNDTSAHHLSHEEGGYDEIEVTNLKGFQENVNDVGEDNGSFWIPPVQPAMPWGENGVPLTKDPEGFINGLYEPLRTTNPDYITRTVLGLDQSGTYNVYRYELTPKNYSKTIIVSAGTHGNEYTASFALARFIYHLVNDWKKYPQLTYIRKNVRLIVHPVNNPWSFANNKRQNANGVDLNRNMAYLWDYITGTNFQQGGTYYKGTAPFSEVESQYLRDSFALYSSALSYVDFHTINTIQAEHIVFTPRYRPQFREIFNDNISRLFKTGNRIVNGTTAMPTIACHAAVTHDMTTANPEWFNGIYGGNRDSVEMTEAVKWFGNVVIKACSLRHKTTQIEESHPFTKLLMYDKGATPSTITSSVYNNVTHATNDMVIKRHGILRANGYVKFTLSEAATVGVNPIIYQVNHPELGYTEVKDQKYNEVVQTLPAGTYVVPLNARHHVFPHNYNEAGTSRPEQTKFRLRMKTSAGTVTIESWRVYLDYLPSERGIAYEIIDYTGKEASAEGSDYTVLFPDATKFAIDGSADE